MREHIVESDYDQIVFGVFSFSRGAALARYFVNLVNQWPEFYNPYDHSDPVPENDLYTVKAFPQSLTGTVAFVGLFDTVGSFYWPANNRQGEFNLNLTSANAERVVYFVSGHDVRHKFPSTRICTQNGDLPANFTEIIVPGVHADVGGGYENPTGHGMENWEIHTLNIIPLPQREREQAIANITRQYHQPKQHPYMCRQLNNMIVEMRKPTRKELAIYYLHLMYEYAVAAGVPFDDMSTNNPAYIIPDALRQQLDTWKQTDGTLEQAKEYLGKYIHTSEETYGDFPWTNRPHKEDGQIVRQVFYSQPAQAIQPIQAEEQDKANDYGY